MAVPSQVATTGDFSAFLTPEQATDYFAAIEKTSIVQQLAKKVPMGPTGISIPHWTGAVTAEWVGEGEQKPLTKGSFSKQDLKPTKIAAIFVESAEVVRLDPLNYTAVMKNKIAEAFAMAFDAATLFGTNKPAAFQGYLSQTTKEVSLADTAATAGNQTNVYQSIGVAGLSLLTNDGKKWNGTLLDNVVEPFLNGSLDGAGRPLFVEAPYSTVTNPFRSGAILGRPTYLSDHVTNGSAGSRTVGFMGDFSQCLWGQIGGITFDVSDQTVINFGTAGSPNFVPLWQNNMVAIRAEAEFAWLCNDTAAFVKLTDKTLPTS